MPITLDRAEIDGFRALVTRRLGLAYEDGKLDYLADILRDRVEAFGYGHAGPYLGRLSKSTEWPEEWRVLAEKLTVGETYFFRYWDHFRAFAEVVLPARSRDLRILSAGCASGEEAYSLAILLRERLAPLGLSESTGAPSVRIHGIDVNPAAIRKASRARYSAWSLRETPSGLRERYFRAEGKDFLLSEAVRERVTFEERNLIEPDPAFWHPCAFDVIFCRNVTMYFPLEVSRAVIDRITQALSPGGYLFLGHAETLRGIAEGFHLRHTHDTFYYQRRGEHEPCPPRIAPPSGTSWVIPSVALLDSSGSWVEAIQRASDRIAALASAPAAHPPDGTETRRTWDLGVILELLRKERYSDAMNLLSALPAESNKDADAQLLRAVILTNGGDLAGARATCRQILEADELHAGAHYLMALCLEHEGDSKGALEHDQTAVYLDATFAMPRFHLGLLAKRRGHVDLAKRELEQALTLLAREDSSRILLFGGGFSRDALADLCRAELRACGGAS